jgi:hypothetical protein
VLRPVLAFAVLAATTLPAFAVSETEMIAESIKQTRASVTKDAGAGASVAFGKLYASSAGVPVICGSATITNSKKVVDGETRFMNSMAGLMFEKDVNAAQHIPFAPLWKKWC